MLELTRDMEDTGTEFLINDWEADGGKGVLASSPFSEG